MFLPSQKKIKIREGRWWEIKKYLKWPIIICLLVVSIYFATGKLLSRELDSRVQGVIAQFPLKIDQVIKKQGVFSSELIYQGHWLQNNKTQTLHFSFAHGPWYSNAQAQHAFGFGKVQIKLEGSLTGQFITDVTWQNQFRLSGSGNIPAAHPIYRQLLGFSPGASDFSVRANREYNKYNLAFDINQRAKNDDNAASLFVTLSFKNLDACILGKACPKDVTTHREVEYWLPNGLQLPLLGSVTEYQNVRFHYQDDHYTDKAPRLRDFLGLHVPVSTTLATRVDFSADKLRSNRYSAIPIDAHGLRAGLDFNLRDNGKYQVATELVATKLQLPNILLANADLSLQYQGRDPLTYDYEQVPATLNQDIALVLENIILTNFMQPALNYRINIGQLDFGQIETGSGGRLINLSANLKQASKNNSYHGQASADEVTLKDSRQEFQFKKILYQLLYEGGQLDDYTKLNLQAKLMAEHAHHQGQYDWLTDNLSLAVKTQPKADAMQLSATLDLDNWLRNGQQYQNLQATNSIDVLQPNLLNNILLDFKTYLQEREYYNEDEYAQLKLSKNFNKKVEKAYFEMAVEHLDALARKRLQMQQQFLQMLKGSQADFDFSGAGAFGSLSTKLFYDGRTPLSSQNYLKMKLPIDLTQELIQLIGSPALSRFVLDSVLRKKQDLYELNVRVNNQQIIINQRPLAQWRAQYYARQGLSQPTQSDKPKNRPTIHHQRLFDFDY